MYTVNSFKRTYLTYVLGSDVCSASVVRFSTEPPDNICRLLDSYNFFCCSFKRYTRLPLRSRGKGFKSTFLVYFFSPLLHTFVVENVRSFPLPSPENITVPFSLFGHRFCCSVLTVKCFYFLFCFFFCSFQVIFCPPSFCFVVLSCECACTKHVCPYYGSASESFVHICCTYLRFCGLPTKIRVF